MIKITAGLLLGILCIGVGTVMLVCLRAFFVFHPFRCARRLGLLLRDRDRRKKLTLALAGTLGVGNIYGVAVGIIVGGAGSVFWLAVSSVFAIVIKYSESVVAVRIGEGQGIMRAFPKAFPKTGKLLSIFYAVLMLALSLVMGSYIQAESFISSAKYLTAQSPLFFAVLFSLLTLAVTVGGSKRIKSVTEYVIPAITLLYSSLTLVIIFKGFSSLPDTLHAVLRSAFSESRAILGMIPAVNTVAFSEGFTRGILSNEAGVGTSSVAISEGESECSAGLFGMCEVVFDTLVLCMLTALALLLTVPDTSRYSSPMTLIFDAFRLGAGEYSLVPLFLCIFFFAFSTVICWYYYGLACLDFLGVKRLLPLYLFLFLLSVMLASLSKTYLAVTITDIILLLMSLPTCAVILKSKNEIREETVKVGLLPERAKKKNANSK